MRTLMTLAPLALMACGGGETTDTTTVTVTDEDTCPDTGCAPFVAPQTAIEFWGLDMWWAYDGEAVVPFNASGTDLTAYATISFYGPSAIECITIIDISDWTLDNGDGNQPFGLRGTLGDGETDCGDDFANLDSATAAAFATGLDLELTFQETIASDLLGYSMSAYSSGTFGSSLNSSYFSQPLPMYTVGWETDVSTMSINGYTATATPAFVQPDAVAPGVFYTYTAYAFYF